MASGGARNRSGPRPDPSSGRSERRGFSLTALPAEGYQDDAPEFPLPQMTDRESIVWAEAWSTPQAAAWARESWRWRTVALWVRWSVRIEDEEAGAALVAQVIRLADQIGLTPAGLKENGWAIAPDEVAERREPTEAAVTSRARRLRAVSE